MRGGPYIFMSCFGLEEYHRNLDHSKSDFMKAALKYLKVFVGINTAVCEVWYKKEGKTWNTPYCKGELGVCWKQAGRHPGGSMRDTDLGILGDKEPRTSWLWLRRSSGTSMTDSLFAGVACVAGEAPALFSS